MTDPAQPWFPIRTERLLLRAFREQDLEAVHAYGSDPEVSRYMDWGPNSLEESRGFMDRIVKAQNAWVRLDFNLAMVEAGADTVIGSITLRLLDADNRTAELGYTLNRHYWRRGLVTEAARAMIDAAFRSLNLHRVVATCDVRNTGSFGVMEKLGMRREAHMLQDRIIKGDWRDTYLYAVLADEWGASS